MRGTAKCAGRQRLRGPRWASLLLVLATVAVGVTAATEPAQAKPNCNVPDPPPACGGPVDPPPDVDTPPRGALDPLAPAPAGIQVRGWASDPDIAGASYVRLYLDGVLTQTVLVSDFRAGVGNHGFDVVLPAAPGAHTVQAVAVNIGGSAASPSLGVRTLDLVRLPAPLTLGRIGEMAPWITVTVMGTSEVVGQPGAVYSIEKAPSSVGPWTPVAQIPAVTTGGDRWTDPSTPITMPGTPCYRTTAYTAIGASLPSNVMCPDGAVPSPTGVQIDFTGPGWITVSWQDNNPQEDTYYVFSAALTPDQGRWNQPYASVSTRPTTAGRVTATVTGLVPGQVYCLSIVISARYTSQVSYPVALPCVRADYMT